MPQTLPEKISDPNIKLRLHMSWIMSIRDAFQDYVWKGLCSRGIIILVGLCPGGVTSSDVCVTLRCRYFVLFYPHATKMTSRTAVVLIGLIWTTPALIFIPWLYVYGQQSFAVGKFEFIACHADWPFPELDRVFTLGAVFFTCYLLPLTFIAVFYVLVGVKVSLRDTFAICHFHHYCCSHQMPVRHQNKFSLILV